MVQAIIVYVRTPEFGHSGLYAELTKSFHCTAYYTSIMVFIFIVQNEL